MVFRSAVFVLAGVAFAAPAFAQGGMAMAAGQMQMTMPGNPLGIDQSRDGSGTSWLPDGSPMQGLMAPHGAWTLMAHGIAFLQYIKTGTDRGDDQFGSVNWFMGMAQRSLAGGQLQLRTMLSLEPLTVGKCGYPSLVQTGEFCNGSPLHDRQHPHDLFMEVAATYRHALGDTVAVEVYGAAVGEPALGPTAFPHRLSATSNPVAPITHHWLDSTHVSFGVVTGGLYGRKWKAEGSVFNGREPDDRRYDFDFAPLDSYSGRVWFLPTAGWALQVSAGHLKDAEFEATGPRQTVDRVTASGTYHRLVSNRVWATTMAWGRNTEAGQSTSAFMAETTMDVTADNTVFARAEIVGKTAGEIVIPLPDTELFTVSKMQVGYTRWLGEGHGFRTGLGGSLGVSVVPAGLQPFYGSAVGGEFAVFLVARVQ